MIINRRGVIKSAGGLAIGSLGTAAVPSLFTAKADPHPKGSSEPHFLLNIVFRPGWDPSYICDARPLAMTQAGKIQNYLNEEPVQLTGANGGTCLVTSKFAPLKPFFDQGQLSIVNGVHMAATFDGHEQNLNFLLTGNPFGGESFIPHLNNGQTPAPIDFLQNGFLYGTVITNGGAGVNLTPDTAKALVNSAKSIGAIDSNSPLLKYVGQRLNLAGSGDGRLAKGAREMSAGLTASAPLSDRMRQIELELSGDDLTDTLKVVHQFYKLGITRSALLEIDDHNLDTHDVQSAKEQPELYSKVVADIEKTLKFLAETKLSETSDKSLLDVTTVMITSEFGRTMRQEGSDIANTGTDHNPLGNSLLMAGKSVRGGWIVGATDFAAADEVLSGAHAEVDQNSVKLMGRPIDLETLQVLETKPTTYDNADYLTFASIANSFYRMFGVPEDKYWTLGRNKPAAKILGGGFLG
jgi:uncharacterized protein (DUF1501 family)